MSKFSYFVSNQTITTMKAAIYLRVSTNQQSTDRQENELTQLVKNQGYELYEIYRDVLSGFKDNEERPNLQRLKNDAKENKIDIIYFSEFSRLARNVNELSNLITFFQGTDTDLYFQKQNLLVKSKNDFVTQILIQVLGVVSSYEIELFSVRSASGKINAIKNRGVAHGGKLTFGYTTDKSKRIVTDIEESAIVQRIFNLYNDYFTAQKIADILNAENIPTGSKKRNEYSNNKLGEKGIKPKKIKIDYTWNESSINYILKNEMYIGKRKYVFFKPDPTNKLNRAKRENREILEEFELQDESLRIITDDCFISAKQKMRENTLKKETATLHPTLLRHKIKCGCCGSNIFSSRTNDVYAYQCYKNLKNKKTKEVECKESNLIGQNKIDGLVISLVLNYILTEKMELETQNKIEKIENVNLNLINIINSKESEIKQKNIEFSQYIIMAIKYNIQSSVIDSTKSNFEKETTTLQKELDKYRTEYNSNIKYLDTLKRLNNNKKLDINSLLGDKEGLKELLDTYIQSIVITPLKDFYSLVNIKLSIGFEVWGFVKAQRYKNSEMIINKETGEKSILTPVYINQFGYCSYNHQTKTFTNTRQTDIPEGDFTIDEFFQLLKNNEMEQTYSYFDYQNL